MLRVTYREAVHFDGATNDSAGLETIGDREAVAAAELHDADIKIVGLDCMPESGARKFVCQIGFVRTNEHSDRIYLDAALVERIEREEWKLLRGLGPPAMKCSIS